MNATLPSPRSFPPQPATRIVAIRSLVLEALVLGYSLIAGAFHSNPPSLAGEPEGLVRLVIAVGAGMLALAISSRVLRDAERSPATLVLDLVITYGSVILSQIILAWLEPKLLLPRWAPTQGGYVGAMLFGATRALLAALADSGHDIPTSSAAWAKEIADTYNRSRTLYGVA